jgi:hypothetical protein
MMWQGSLGGGVGVGGRTPKTGRMTKAALIATPGPAGAPGQEAMPVWRVTTVRGMGVRGLPVVLVTTGQAAGPTRRHADSTAGPVSPGSPPGGQGRVTAARAVTNQADRMRRLAAGGCRVQARTALRGLRASARTRLSQRGHSTWASFPAVGRRGARRRPMGTLPTGRSATGGGAARSRMGRLPLRPTPGELTAAGSTERCSPMTPRCAQSSPAPGRPARDVQPAVLSRSTRIPGRSARAPSSRAPSFPDSRFPGSRSRGSRSRGSRFQGSRSRGSRQGRRG